MVRLLPLTIEQTCEFDQNNQVASTELKIRLQKLERYALSKVSQGSASVMRRTSFKMRPRGKGKELRLLKSALPEETLKLKNANDTMKSLHTN